MWGCSEQNVNIAVLKGTAPTFNREDSQNKFPSRTGSTDLLVDPGGVCLLIHCYSPGPLVMFIQGEVKSITGCLFKNLVLEFAGLLREKALNSGLPV